MPTEIVGRAWEARLQISEGETARIADERDFWRYHRLGDEAWLSTLLDSIEGRALLPMPTFPSAELQAGFVGSANEKAIREAWGFYMLMAEGRHRHGLNLGINSHVLDFGCGWGRYARMFLRDVPANNIWCADSWDLALKTCRETGVPGRMIQLQQMPPSTLPTAQFDTAFAYSVFSHLSPLAHRAWRDEFSRIIKPGGIAFITTQAEWFIDYCQWIRENPSMITHYWQDLLAKSFVDTEECKARYLRGEFLYAANGGGPALLPEFYGDAVVPRAFFEAEWSQDFELLDFIADRSRCEQAVAIVRRRATTRQSAAATADTADAGQQLQVTTRGRRAAAKRRSSDEAAPRDERDFRAIVAAMVGQTPACLYLGRDNPELIRALSEKGCQVTVVTAKDKAAIANAHRVVIHDLEAPGLGDAIGEASFDVVVIADVLQHLRDGTVVIRACMERLAPHGEVVISVPNIAHGDVRLALAGGSFEYRPAGLVAEDTVRFFTIDSLRDLLAQCNLVELELRRTTENLGSTEIAPVLDRLPELLEQLESDPDALTYRFILRAAPALENSHLAELARHRTDLISDVEELRRTVLKLEAYRFAHRRLMNLVCPDVLDADVAGPTGSQTREMIDVLQRAVRKILEDRDLQARERDEMRLTQAALEDARDQVDATRRSETYRAGRVVLSPIFAARLAAFRIRKAWRQSRYPQSDEHV